MTFESELKRLCEDFIKVLFDLKNRQEISDEELKSHLKTKLNFLKECDTEFKYKSIQNISNTILKSRNFMDFNMVFVFYQVKQFTVVKY